MTDEPTLLGNPTVPARLGRVLAIFAMACLVAHVPLIANHFWMAPMTSIVMALVSVVCVPCARKLWSAPTTQDCAVAGALAATMVGLHVTLALSTNGPEAGHANMIPTAHVGHIAVNTPTGIDHADAAMTADPHMTMTPALETVFHLATGLAIAQTILSGLVIASTARRDRRTRSRSAQISRAGFEAGQPCTFEDSENLTLVSNWTSRGHFT